MNSWGALLGSALLTITPASAALVYYELTLTTGASYTAFGGGDAGEVFTGLFAFDESLLGSANPVWPYLTNDDFFLEIGINDTTFSTEAPGTVPGQDSVRLRFEGGPLLDIYFDIANADGESLYVVTDGANPNFWSAAETGGAPTVGGAPLPSSVQFTPTTIPEPSSWALSALGSLILLRRRRSKVYP